MKTETEKREWEVVQREEPCDNDVGLITRLCVVESSESPHPQGEIVIAGFYNPSRDCLEVARLIRSAPDLLAALENLVDKSLIMGMETGEDNDHIDECLAAIAKAKGDRS